MDKATYYVRAKTANGYLERFVGGDFEPEGWSAFDDHGAHGDKGNAGCAVVFIIIVVIGMISRLCV